MNALHALVHGECLDEAHADLEDVVSAVARRFPSTAGTPTTRLSFALGAASGLCTVGDTVEVSVEVPIAAVVDFLVAADEETSAAGLADISYSFAPGVSSAGGDITSLYGIIVEVAGGADDIIREVRRAGVPMPTFVVPRPAGFVLAYASAEPIQLDRFAELAMKLSLAFDGCAAGSSQTWDVRRAPTAPLHAPEADGSADHTFAPMFIEATPFQATPDAVPFPLRLARTLGAGACTRLRGAVRQYLQERGTPAPPSTGRAFYPTCPVADAHDSACCCVTCHDDGQITVDCVDDHGGKGPKRWSEAELAALAIDAEAAEAAERAESFDPLRDLPVTLGAVQFVRSRLQRWPAAHAEAAVSLWTREWARRETRALAERANINIDPVQMLGVYAERTGGVHGLPAMRTYYERLSAQLVHDDPDGRALAITSRLGPNLRANALELKSTALWTLTAVERKGRTVTKPGWCEDAPSLVHLLALGHAHVLARAGVTAVTTYTLPVAHVTPHIGVSDRNLNLEEIAVRNDVGDAPDVDAEEYFLDLFRKGRLPFATEDDVRRFLMCVAAPLLRHIAPGQLGVYWFIGSPGAGKDFFAEMPRRIWEACGQGRSRVSFDVSLAGSLEEKRMIEMGAGCVYARAKEAGKRPGMVETLIRLAGTDSLPGRGLFKSEITVPNAFTYVVESSEDLPDRREISRRTVTINLTPMGDKVSKGEVLDDIVRNARGIIKSLKRRVESEAPTWYLHQTDTGSRPLIPVALAKLFGATLSAVEGEDLTDLYEAMLKFVESPEGIAEGRAQLATMTTRSNKVSLQAKTLPSHRLALFVDTMRRKPGNAELFSPYAHKSKELANRIKRETEYRAAVAAQGYLPLEIRGSRFALRVEDDRRFILLPAENYIAKMAQACAGALE